MKKRSAAVLLALFVAVLLCVPVAMAQPKRGGMIQDYTPSNSSDKQGQVDKRALARGNSGQLRDYGLSGQKKKKKDPMVPVYAIGLIVFLIAGSAPFAVKLMGEHTKRLADEATFGRNPEGVGAPVGKPVSSRRKEGMASSGSNLARLDDNSGSETSPSLPLASPEEVHEKVWYTLGDAGKWLSAEGVARLAKLDLEQCREELKALSSEGHIDESKDRTGRPIYKMPVG